MAQNFWKSSHAQQWIFDKTEIWKQRGEDMKVYNEEEYNRLNIFWANFITAVATEYAHSHANGGYKLRQQMIATAIVYFKRFYLRQSFRDICPFLVASTALFLACKVEETSIPTSASSFLKHTSTVLQKRWAVPFEPNPAKHGGIYDPEFLLVEILDCCLVVHHPFRPMAEFLDDFRQFSLSASGTNTPVKDTDAIEAQCQKVANDSLRCDVGLIFPPHIVALSSIIVAMELMGRGEELEGWLVEVDVDIEKVIDCVDQIYKMYTLWKSFDEKEEVKKLMAKLPKPNSPITHQQQQPSTSNNYF
ncbi:hypothetical protein CAEBREN_17055 [Caenorhabditis brenneri]|uniref:Cyclin-like domain-containing protein n=1 Tax=Caenorhabditis brenneri TaxID=135651 RepID=G0P1N9_CAEBE|nr:hypothetical protein CAEBREN_17055 [Caenorhabditis brenneri]